MKTARAFRFLAWFNVPSMVLVSLLQRTPVLRIVATSGELVSSSPLGAVVKSAVALLGSLGAVSTLAGATSLSATTTSPAAATVGTAKTIAYSVLGTQSPASSWTVGGSVPPGMTFNGGATLGIINIPSGFLTLTGTPTTAGTYVLSLRAWENSNGTGNVSPTFSYTVNVTGAAATLPAFTTQPATQTVTAGATVTFTASASGTPAPTYQWRKDGSPLGGATATSLSLTNVQASNAGAYTVVATNSAGSATSSAATLTVNAAAVVPVITTQPASQTAIVGQTVTLSVVATGSPAPTFQWSKDGSALPGATGSSLSLSNVQVSNAGSYTVVVTNTAGTATSSAATLAVNAASVAPLITVQPANQVAIVGQAASFAVVATGTPVPTYQWSKDGSALSGATGSSLSLSNVQVSNAGSYTVVVTNTAGTATSSAATLAVTAAAVAPSITVQPANQVAAVGQTASFAVVATGTPVPTYQWRKDGVALTGQTAATLTLSNVQSSNAGAYSVIATNSAGAATSTAATLVVNAAPAITTPPASQSVSAGQAATFVVVATGSPTPNYQWSKDGAILIGATGTSLVINNAQIGNAGSYTVTATNSVGIATSAAATLTITSTASAPAFTAQPVNQVSIVGQTVGFTFTSTGSPTPTFQWLKDGVNLVGETGLTLTLSNLQPSNAGSYTVVATNSAGTVTSNAATLTVNTASVVPTITTQPSNQSVAAGQSASFVVVVAGVPSPTYQWSRNGVPIAGATAALLNITAAQVGDAGSYVVTASNASGAISSTAATLTVLDGGATSPKIASQPPGALSLVVGQSLALNVGATGVGLTYQWRRTNATGTVDVAGATEATLTLKPFTAADAGTYLCRVSNGGGSVDSLSADITVAASAANPGRLINLSVLTGLAASGDSFSLGYVVAGATATRTKPLVIRAAGPSLGALGVPGTLIDPAMEFFAGSVKMGENDNWGGSAAIASAMAAVGAFPYVNAVCLDSAVAANVNSKDNSVKIFAGATAPNATGSVIAEVYDASPASSYDAAVTPRLVNLSVLKNVGTGLTMGFVIGGTTAKTMLVRAVGPALGTVFGIGGVMADPKIELFAASGKSLATNDNWGGTSALSAAFVDTGAFVLPPASRDAALVITLPPGNYTAQVTVATGETGLALVEVYEVP